MPRDRMFTIYDALEKAGIFDANPANSFSRDKTTGASIYTGPQEYPKMLYHPEGEQQVTVPGEVLMTPFGPKLVGEQKETLWMTVQNPVEEAAAAAEGWHDHPAKAIGARVRNLIASSNFTPAEEAKLLKTIPMIVSDKIKDLEAQIAALLAERDARPQVADPTTAPAPAQTAPKAAPGGKTLVTNALTT